MAAARTQPPPSPPPRPQAASGAYGLQTLDSNASGALADFQARLAAYFKTAAAVPQALDSKA